VTGSATSYAQARIGPEVAGKIAEEELAELKSWLENRWNATPRDTKVVHALLKYLPGGKKLTAMAESAPYLLTLGLIAHPALFGTDLLVLGGYTVATWLTERLSNEVAAKTRAANVRIAERFTRLAHEQIQKICAWINQQAIATRTLDQLDTAAADLARRRGWWGRNLSGTEGRRDRGTERRRDRGTEGRSDWNSTPLSLCPSVPQSLSPSVPFSHSDFLWNCPEMPPLSAAQLLFIARQHYDAGRLPEAQGLCGKILSGDPACAAALHLGRAHGGAHGPARGGGAFLERAVVLRRTILFPCGLARMCRRLRRIEQAIAAYRRSLCWSRKVSIATWSCGHAIRAGDWDQAIEAYRRALVLRPDALDVLLGLGDRAAEGR